MTTLLAPHLQAYPNILHAFFCKETDNTKMINTTHLSHPLKNPLIPLQKHTSVCLFVDEKLTQRPLCDALVTTTPHLALGVVTADCAPVILFDRVHQVLGVAHAGWRGAKDGILEQTIHVMEKHGATRSTLCAAVGPCISQRAYEVGLDFYQVFMAQNPKNTSFFKTSPRAEHLFFDLQAYVVSRLAAMNIEHVDALNVCTYSTPDLLFSYRRRGFASSTAHQISAASIITNSTVNNGRDL